jgi:predicted acetyltransferase
VIARRERYARAMEGSIASVEVTEASPEARVWIRNVYPLYLHDLSAFTEFYELDEHGVWFPDYLPEWLDLKSPLVHPMLIRADGKPCGFAFVGQAPFPHMTPGRDYRMSEFFVLARYRRRGVGQRAAHAIFDTFRGVWEVSELPANAGAVRFWRSVIGEYTGGLFEDTIEKGDVVQVFDNG